MNDFEVKASLRNASYLTEKRLVYLFAPPSIQERYKSKGRFEDKDKKRVLKEASRFCDIVDKTNRKYYVRKVYDATQPSNFNKMNKELYQYICPLILKLILKDSTDDVNKYVSTAGVIAKEIKMVNKNYRTIKNNAKLFKEQLNLDKHPKAFYDFYSHCDALIEYYILHSLDYLQNAGLVEYHEVYMLKTTNVVNLNGNLYSSTRSLIPFEMNDKYRASFDEAVQTADVLADIQRPSERYYSSKACKFKSNLKKELEKRSIAFVYKAYYIHYLSGDRCDEVLNMFNQYNSIDNFNAEFRSKLVNNATTRSKNYDNDEANAYWSIFNRLCDITVDNKARNVEEYLV